jgi:hypothetical protein
MRKIVAAVLVLLVLGAAALCRFALPGLSEAPVSPQAALAILDAFFVS